jgi:nucleoside-diphosphate-sugar epimerase
MGKSISILGCGWLGFPLAKRFVEIGYDIKGSTTSSEKINQLRDIGVDPFVVNISNKENKITEFLSSEILIVSITSKNIQDYKHLLKQVKSSLIKKVIFISSTSVYVSNNDIVTEDSPITDSKLVEIENLFRSNEFKSTIIRFSGLVGYSRSPGNFHKLDTPIKNPEGFINLIHRDDCIHIIEIIIRKNIWGKIYNACSDYHPKRREFYTKKRNDLGNKESTFLENESLEYKIVDSSRLKQDLEFKFKHPNLLTTFE